MGSSPTYYSAGRTGNQDPKNRRPEGCVPQFSTWLRSRHKQHLSDLSSQLGQAKPVGHRSHSR